MGANGEIWTGQGTATDHRMPSLETIPRKKWPDENVLSISFRLSYGKFKFFNGGDIPGIRQKSPAWYDMETPVAKVVGPVDAAILDHHGYLDSMNESLRRHVERPGLDDLGLGRPSSDAECVGTLAVGTPVSGCARHLRHRRASRCTTAIKDIDRMASSHGHIVLRVSPGGDDYRVTIVDDTSESHHVIKVCGPYWSR